MLQHMKYETTGEIWKKMICHLMAMLRLFTASVVNIGRVAVDSEVRAPSDAPLLTLVGGI